MSRIHKLTALVFLVLWVPITAHCLLEKVPGLEFLHCATDTPGNSDCQGDSCDVVERGAYKAPDNGDVFLKPPVAPVMCEIAEILLVADRVPDVAAMTTDLPVPERSDSWEYYSSRALAIRGPSLLS